MSVATSNTGALIMRALPEQGVSRFAAQLFLVVAGTLLLTLSAKTKVMLGPVDMSLQTLAVFLISAAFGMRMAVATLVLYMVQGAMGFPVFQSSPEKGVGLAYMLGGTGGYLAGFVAMAAIVGWAADRGWGRSVVKFAAAVLVAEVVMMALGFGWLAALIGAEKAWQFGVVPFIVPDLIKAALAIAIVPAGLALLPKGLRG